MSRLLLSLAPLLACCAISQAQPFSEMPLVNDKRLVIEQFAAAPDIVHPIALDFDAKGRLLVIESHTHFPPAGYQGPKHDRIRMLEDTDGDGRADRFTTFFEGTIKTMDLAVAPSGWVYLATRNEVLRLRDTDGDGKADIKERIAFLDTKGDYPHNGLSGLCFDAQGGLYFGMGENLGASYKLTGRDGTTISGEGDGGHIFHCSADGKMLRRVATGFWNPFGIGRDIFGRIFAVDNDPDAMPPCRLLHVVEGGDYGFQFRYGRQGRHPFQAWNGELPGTLPMVSGTGEAPCEVLSYESDGLPEEYLGDLLVTSWADHRVERYRLKPKGASFTAERLPFVQGGKDFRPVGLAVAPDGSLFFSDWVLRDYNLHQRGAIWHIRSRDARKLERPTESRQALLSRHRPLRDAAARKLAADPVGRAFLRQQLANPDVRVRAASFTALLDGLAGDELKRELPVLAAQGSEPGMRSLAVGVLAALGDTRSFLADPTLKAEAITCLTTKEDLPRLLELLRDADPFVRTRAVQQLARGRLTAVAVRELSDAGQRVGLLLAHRESARPEGRRLIPMFLADPDEDVRFLAVKWIADEKLAEHRALVVEALKERGLNVRMYWAFSTALARLDGQEVNENKLADLFFSHVADEQAPPAVRAMALQLVPARHPRLTLDFLAKLLSQPDATLQREACRALGEHPNAARSKILLKAAADAALPEATRAQAVAALAEQSTDHVAALLAVGDKSDGSVRQEVLRALTNVSLPAEQRRQVEELGQGSETRDLAARDLGQPFFRDRPSVKDTAAWLARLEGPADVAAGRRIFAHPRLAYCARCHRVEGRGADVGPDLSTIGRTERRHMLESILQPSISVAPHYQAWLIETADGLVRTGMLIHTQLDEYTYLDEKGGKFKINTRDVVSTRPLPTSIMPDGLADRLTDQELRDLLAYLDARR
jgi:putative membrane-bound dehydrogenase-like protein